MRLALSSQVTFHEEDCDLLITPAKVAEHLFFSKSSVDELYEIGYKEGKKLLPQLIQLSS